MDTSQTGGDLGALFGHERLQRRIVGRQLASNAVQALQLLVGPGTGCGEDAGRLALGIGQQLRGIGTGLGDGSLGGALRHHQHRRRLLRLGGQIGVAQGDDRCTPTSRLEFGDTGSFPSDAFGEFGEMTLQGLDLGGGVAAFGLDACQAIGCGCQSGVVLIQLSGEGLLGESGLGQFGPCCLEFAGAA